MRSQRLPTNGNASVETVPIRLSNRSPASPPSPARGSEKSRRDAVVVGDHEPEIRLSRKKCRAGRQTLSAGLTPISWWLRRNPCVPPNGPVPATISTLRSATAGMTSLRIAHVSAMSIEVRDCCRHVAKHRTKCHSADTRRPDDGNSLSSATTPKVGQSTVNEPIQPATAAAFCLVRDFASKKLFRFGGAKRASEPVLSDKGSLST